GRASRRMETLTRDLLEFNRVSRQEVVLSRVEIEPILEDLIVMRSPSLRNALTIKKPLPPVRAHRGLLERAFHNLIDNALKFVQPQSTPKITISAELLSESSPNTRSGPLLFSSMEPT